MIECMDGVLTINLLDDIVELEPMETNSGLLWNGDLTTRCYLALYYDIEPIGDPYCLGNWCGAYDCIYNGGEYYYTISDIAIDELENGKSYTFYPLDENYINECILNDEN